MSSPFTPFTRSCSITSLEPFPHIDEESDLPGAIFDVATAVLDGGILDGDIFVVACKPVSIVEKLSVLCSSVSPSAQAHALAATSGNNQSPEMMELILREARPGTVAVVPNRGSVRANSIPLNATIIGLHRRGYGPLTYAGIDRDWRRDEEAFLLLPENCDRSAAEIRNDLVARSGTSNIAVILSDTEFWADRTGALAMAMGSAGMHPQRTTPSDYPHGRAYESLVDLLANAAALTIGQSNRFAPVAVIRGVAFEPSETLGVLDMIKDADFS